MNRNGLVVLSCAVMLVLAGCAGGGGDPMANNSSDTDSPIVNGDVEADSPTTEDDVHHANPYGQAELVVALNDTATDQDVEPLVEEALAYWEANSEAYAGYPIEYDLQPDATNPDVKIHWRGSITSCGIHGSETFLGCADLVTEEPTGAATIEIEDGYTNESTLQTVKHEIGHTLGLEHDDEPHDLMAGEYGALPDPITADIVWNTSGHDRDAVREQIEHGLGYYESWSKAHMDQNITIGELSELEAYEDASEELVIVVSDDEDACGEEYISCTDEDPETFDFEITLANPRDDVTGWLTADLFSYYLYLEGDDRPAAFDELDADIAASEWWTDVPK
ncbi:matrixin family metalloprotease [Natronorubrum sp. DTA7]|uniref:matrixin family metalloprotease n=1 Tax=Natronorubrum sp. DTA7 TaxID=3447016 RepID=UPI003F82BF4A